MLGTKKPETKVLIEAPLAASSATAGREGKDQDMAPHAAHIPHMQPRLCGRLQQVWARYGPGDRAICPETLC